MSKKWVITIGREFCSGGAEAAKAIADAFGFRYLDKQLVDQTAEMLSVTSELVQEQDETPQGYFDIPVHWYIDPDDPTMSLSDAARVSMTQDSIIKNYAEEGNCVIVGRCADYTLRNNPDLITVFLHSSPDKRIARATELYDITFQKAERLIRKTDKKRAQYYNRNTKHRRWGSPSNYDLYLDLGVLGIDGVIQAIKEKMAE